MEKLSSPLVEQPIDESDFPFSLDHPGNRPLRLMIQVYGLWRPRNSPMWIPYQVLLFLCISLFLLLWIAFILGLDVAAFFQRLSCPMGGFGKEPAVLALSLNALPVVSYLCTFFYLNHHLTPRLGFKEGPPQRIDTELHLGMILIRAEKTGNQVLFQKRILKRAMVYSLLHLICGVSIGVWVSLSSHNASWIGSIAYTLLVVLWSSPPFIFAFIFDTCCLVHRMELSDLMITSRHVTDIAQLCKRASTAVESTSIEFSKLLVMECVVIGVSFLGVAYQIIAGCTEVLFGHAYAWFWIFLVACTFLLLHGLFEAACVTDVCHRVIRAVNDRHESWKWGECGESPTDIAATVSYLVHLRMGFYLGSLLVDIPLFPKIGYVFCGVLVLCIQHLVNKHSI